MKRLILFTIFMFLSATLASCGSGTGYRRSRVYVGVHHGSPWYGIRRHYRRPVVIIPPGGGGPDFPVAEQLPGPSPDMPITEPMPDIGMPDMDIPDIDF